MMKGKMNLWLIVWRRSCPDVDNFALISPLIICSPLYPRLTWREAWKGKVDCPTFEDRLFLDASCFMMCAWHTRILFKKKNRKDVHFLNSVQFYVSFCQYCKDFPQGSEWSSKMHVIIWRQQRYILQSAKAFVRWVNLRSFWLSFDEVNATSPVQSLRWGLPEYVW